MWGKGHAFSVKGGNRPSQEERREKFLSDPDVPKGCGPQGAPGKSEETRSRRARDQVKGLQAQVHRIRMTHQARGRGTEKGRSPIS